MTTAFWGMTINNYDETDLALVQQGYPDHIRQIVYTLEKGESGTPHVQAYIRLYRQQRLSYMKKLFPRGSFKALMAEEYKLNAQRYAQKLDNTAESPAVITNNPFPDPVQELLGVIRDAFETFHPTSNPFDWTGTKVTNVSWWKEQIEKLRVEEKPHLAKFYVSPTYTRVWSKFSHSLVQHVIARVQSESGNPSHTHTHTHTREKFSREGGIATDASRTPSENSETREEDDSSCSEEDDYGEGDEDCEGTGTDDSGSGGSDCSSDD